MAIMDNRIIQSTLPFKELPSISASMYLLGHLLQHQDKQLIIDCPTGCTWNGKEIYEASISIADAFINVFNLEIGDSVCFWCPNSDVHAIAFLATLCSGAVYVACDMNYTDNDVLRVSKLSGAKILICLSENLKQALHIMKSLKTLQHLFTIDQNISNDSNEFQNYHLLMNYMRYKSKPAMDSSKIIPIIVESSDLAVIHFIKAYKDGIPSQLIPIIRTHRNLIQSAGQLHHNEIYQIASQDCISPKHFSDYFGIIMFCHALVAGSKIAFTKHAFNRQQNINYIQKYGITNISIDLNELLYLMRNDVTIRGLQTSNSVIGYDLSSLYDILHSGSPLPHSDIIVEEVFTKLRPKYFRAIYGKPETGVISCVWRSLSTFEKSFNYFNVGYPVPGVQIKIIHPQTEKSRPKNKIGEICVKSEQIISKDRNLSIVTRNAFTIDGFFKTGDAGYYDSEGLLYIECRVNEMIYSGNEEIAPLALETLLSKHPSVKEVAVIGISDAKYGEITRAFVVLNPNQIVTEKSLLDFIESRGKQLKGGIKFIGSMPRTARSKVNRMALRIINSNLHTYSLIEMI